MHEQFYVQLGTITADTLFSFGFDKGKAHKCYNHLVTLHTEGLLPGTQKIELCCATISEGEVIAEEILAIWREVHLRFLRPNPDRKSRPYPTMAFKVNTKPRKMAFSNPRWN